MLDLLMGWHVLGTARNDFVFPPRQFKCRLLIETRIVDPLVHIIIPFEKVTEMGLKEIGDRKDGHGFGDGVAEMIKFQPILVTLPLEDQHQIGRVKEAYLNVYAPTPSSTVPEFKKDDGCVPLKPLRMSDEYSPAILSKSGLEKLGLTLDVQNHVLRVVPPKSFFINGIRVTRP